MRHPTTAELGHEDRAPVARLELVGSTFTHSDAAVRHAMRAPEQGTKRRFSPQVAAITTGRLALGEVAEHKEAEPRKRARGDSRDQPQPTGQPKRPESPQTPVNNRLETPQRPFACPFFRQDPSKHRDCPKYNLNRIKDVKQHIYRRHKQPDFYCARCYKIFETAERRDVHARNVDCKRLPSPQHEGITDDQKNELAKYNNRGKPAEMQWYDIWDVVFPDARNDRSKSIYVGSVLEESVPLLRSFWDDNGTEILAKVSLARFTNATTRQEISSVVRCVFDYIEAAAGAAALDERGAHDQDAYPSSALTTLSELASDPCSGMSSASRSKSHPRTPAVLTSPCGSLESVGSLATDDDPDSLGPWHSPTRPMKVGVVVAGNPDLGHLQLSATRGRSPGDVHWSFAPDNLSDPQYLSSSDFPHPDCEGIPKFDPLFDYQYPSHPFTE